MGPVLCDTLRVPLMRPPNPLFSQQALFCPPPQGRELPGRPHVRILMVDLEEGITSEDRKGRTMVLKTFSLRNFYVLKKPLMTPNSSVIGLVSINIYCVRH